MAKNTKSNKKSNARKLIPAAGMLAVSAVMLSTSTYAWFTMNKEVEVTGLQMKATTGNSIELSVGSIGVDMTKLGSPATVAPVNNTYGTWDDYGWQRSIDIDDYYGFIAKLKPASTNTALNMVYAPDSDIRAAGAKVLPTSGILDVGAMDTGVLVLDEAYRTADLTNESTPEKSARYIDIPMWIRTNESAANKAIQAWVSIDDSNTLDTDLDDKTSDLKNAVRVAFIPIQSTTGMTTVTGGVKGDTNWNGKSYTQAASLTMDSSTKLADVPVIFGLNNAHYGNTVLDANSNGKTYGGGVALVTPPTISQAITATAYNTLSTTTNGWENATNGVKIFNMPQAANDNYACVQFVCRIWLEGESTSCNDATADNDWSINMHFNLVDNTPAGTGT